MLPAEPAAVGEREEAVVEVESYDEGVPSWVDLGTPDPTKAADFYSQLFGWDVQVGPPEAGGYAIAHLRGRSVAGLGPQQHPGPPAWSTYVNVADADAVIARVSQQGGQVFVEPFDVMEVGRMAVFADPVGAVISLWQPGAHTGAGIVNEPNTYSWSELITTDIAAASDFYEKVFGWKADGHGEGASAYYEWKLNDRSIGGMMTRPPQMPAEVPPHWGVYFTVADTDQAVARINESGGSTLAGPMDIEPGRFAAVMDPTGAPFNVIAMTPTP
jgi:predicted enzyme related to lactoylglutathione lyase